MLVAIFPPCRLGLIGVACQNYLSAWPNYTIAETVLQPNMNGAGCVPSTSVKPHSRASSPVLYAPPLRRITSASVASATTARPAYLGDSELASSAADANRSTRSVRVSPGYSASAAMPCALSFLRHPERHAVNGRLRGVVHHLPAILALVARRYVHYQPLSLRHHQRRS